jgi:amidase
MHRIPGLADIEQTAEDLGIRLSPEEAVIYHSHLARLLDGFDDFLQTRFEETEPPRYPGAREHGYRPSREDDMHNAWMWKTRIEGASSGLLRGKTVAFKDHVAVAGIPQTFGAYALEGFIPNYDATIVSRALEQGATVVGKNTMNGLAGGFAFGGATGDYERPLNPHSPSHLTGGSSSGSAVAVALGEVDISFGGDQGGSIRIPAAWSGTIGHKPTFGLVSHFGVGFGSDQSIDFVGPLTRTVEDAARALDSVAGYDGLDPRQSKKVPDSYDSISRLGDGIAGLRIAIVEEGFVGATPEVESSVRDAIRVLEKLGAVATTVSIPTHLQVNSAQAALSAEGTLAIRSTGFFGAFAQTYYPSDTIVAINRLWENHQATLDPRSTLSILAGTYSRRYFGGRTYAKAQNTRAGFTAAYDRALVDADVLVMPTTLTQAPEYARPSEPAAVLEAALTGAMGVKAINNTQPFNFTGHPALAVPTEKRNGLPVSLQLIGRKFEDDLLLRVAQTYTEAVPFDDYISVAP